MNHIIKVIEEINDINKSIMKRYIDIEQKFKELDDLLIVRTASIDLTDKLLEQVIGFNLVKNLKLVTYRRDFKYFSEKYNNIELIEYPYDGTYKSEDLQKFLSNQSFDKVCIIYNNSNGEGYLEIEKGLASCRETMIFTADFSFFEVSNINLKILNQQMLDHLINWSLARKGWI